MASSFFFVPCTSTTTTLLYINILLQAVHERAGDNAARLEEYNKRLETIEKKMNIVVMSVISHDKRLELVESK